MWEVSNFHRNAHREFVKIFVSIRFYCEKIVLNSFHMYIFFAGELREIFRYTSIEREDTYWLLNKKRKRRKRTLQKKKRKLLENFTCDHSQSHCHKYTRVVSTWKTWECHEIPTNLEKSWIFSESGKNLKPFNLICLIRKKIENKFWLLRFENVLCKVNRIM